RHFGPRRARTRQRSSNSRLAHVSTTSAMRSRAAMALPALCLVALVAVGAAAQDSTCLLQSRAAAVSEPASNHSAGKSETLGHCSMVGGPGSGLDAWTGFAQVDTRTSVSAAGTVTQFSYWGGSSSPVYLQIMRPYSGNTYTLVGEVYSPGTTVGATNYVSANIPVQAGDYLGWSFVGTAAFGFAGSPDACGTVRWNANGDGGQRTVGGTWTYNSGDCRSYDVCATIGSASTPSPTPYPTVYPTPYPTPFPTPIPTPYPTSYPTAYPTAYPTVYPTSYPTPFPTPSPTSSPTYPPNWPTPHPTFPSGVPLAGGAGASVAATGDPHLQNVLGQRFDLMKPGKHILINIPRGRHKNVLLRVQADARKLGGQCADMYFQELNITGQWVEAKGTSGLRFQSDDVHNEQPKWLQFGTVQVKVAHGHTQDGAKYLSLYVKHLGHSGLAVGGLLGEDDHSDAAMSSDGCAHHIPLLELPSTSAQSASVFSVAEASFD
ncbi:unnamed protein product, partial [Prorocentrum cordatum]